MSLRQDRRANSSKPPALRIQITTRPPMPLWHASRYHQTPVTSAGPPEEKENTRDIQAGKRGASFIPAPR